ncbi:peptidoglycan recognition family protein [Conexibacter sp. JD483]|uniref:peptidoglycan recognition protein family protein n=1 Tax=unclassified Conexibacter TaxID=2627773 RepID=UPI002721D60A|nr:MULTISPECIES: peptidoglycan recognition family protein [unclassified Conexibacter]MDO8187990.1 peptidoglycan recognition family protein [Conexibacter sp. CPCC 205706]MDO8200873.1 peptidoglycan recognition family protein [Conexibacter sp. CPCC 205762]MDR9370394.1 peptidoglycan recognition family protein [Conexibacter sp. JD483]
MIALLLALAALVSPQPAREAPARTSAAGGAVVVARPRVTRRFIPLTQQRRRDTAAYARRHYGLDTTTVTPHVIVEHWTQTDSVDATYYIFAPNVPDAELHERPGTCSQFVIARSGRIFQLTPVTFLCRHTVGLNWAAIGIEHVGFSDGEVLGNRAQMDASLRLTRWLRCTYEIPVRDVIGHAESLSSPFHRERVASLRQQTHDDFQPTAMNRYRERLRAAGDCPRPPARLRGTQAAPGRTGPS